MENVFKQDASIAEAVQRGELVRALLNGTPGMVAGGRKFLPPYEAETHTSYDSRLRLGVLFNGYKRTRDFIVGLIFSSELLVQNADQYPEVFLEVQDNTDLKGNNLRTWGQEVFELGMDSGIVAIMVDYPKLDLRNTEAGLQFFNEKTQAWENKTAEADKAMGLRPRLVAFDQRSILGYRYDEQGIYLDQIRFLESVVEPGEIDADDKVVEQVRVLERGKWEVWRKGEKDKPHLHASGTMSVKEIPVALFTPGAQINKGFAPALEDLAQLNRSHWQATCDQKSLMSYVRRPPWFGKLLVSNDSDELKFGPGYMCHSSDPQADLRSVGVDQGSPEAGRKDLGDIEAQMASYGLQLLVPNMAGRVSKTATQAAQEGQESVSQIKDWAQAFEDTLNNCMRFVNMWIGGEDGTEPVVSVNKDFQPGMGLDPATLVSLYKEGILPKQLVFSELQRRNMISDSWEWEEVLALMARDVAAPTRMPDIGGLAIGDFPG